MAVDCPPAVANGFFSKRAASLCILSLCLQSLTSMAFSSQIHAVGLFGQINVLIRTILAFH